jgi:hypothetical protein
MSAIALLCALAPTALPAAATDGRNDHLPIAFAPLATAWSSRAGGISRLTMAAVRTGKADKAAPSRRVVLKVRMLAHRIAADSLLRSAACRGLDRGVTRLFSVCAIWSFLFFVWP